MAWTDAARLASAQARAAKGKAGPVIRKGTGVKWAAGMAKGSGIALGSPVSRGPKHFKAKEIKVWSAKGTTNVKAGNIVRVPTRYITHTQAPVRKSRKRK